MSIKNKTVIITGAATGIGKATALEMARKKAKLVIIDVDGVGLKEVTEKIKYIGAEVISINIDVKKEQNIKKIIKRTKRNFKTIDILINNARSLSLDSVTEKEWDNIIKVNLKGAYLFIKNISEHMKENKKGKIVTITSTAGIVNLKNNTAHAISNGGLIQLTKQMAVELSSYNINVNCVSPGIIATPLIKELLDDKKRRKELLLNIPLKRIGTPEEVADSIIFLAGDKSDFITGHNLVVDGGWLSH